MNKKLFKFASMLLVATFLCVGFSACDDGDDDKKQDNATEQTDEENTDEENTDDDKTDGTADEKTDENIEIYGYDGILDGYAWVDLGLPSRALWATCNVGAENPWDYGDYFAWGETVPYGKEDRSNGNNFSYNLENDEFSYVKTYYDWSTYKYGTRSDLTKYCCTWILGKNDFTDNDIYLNPEDNAVIVNMGDKWTMPFDFEQKELIDNCYWEWTDNYNGKGVGGYIVYKHKAPEDRGKVKRKYPREPVVTTVGSYNLSDAHIFFPAAGYRSKADLKDDGYRGYYWSLMLCEDFLLDYCARYLYMANDNLYEHGLARCDGYSVRGVVKN